MSLPYVSQLSTPGFLSSLDDGCGAGHACGSRDLSGAQFRVVVTMGVELFLVFMYAMVGISVTSEIGPGVVPDAFYANFFIRFIAGGLGLFGGAAGVVGALFESAFVLFLAVILHGIAVLGIGIAWIVDAGNAGFVDAAAQNKTEIENVGGQNFTPELATRTVVTTIFGVLAWILVVVGFLFLYMLYQESGGGDGGAAAMAPAEPKPPKEKKEKPPKEKKEKAPKGGSGAAAKPDKPTTANEIVLGTVKMDDDPRHQRPSLMRLSQAQSEFGGDGRYTEDVTLPEGMVAQNSEYTDFDGIPTEGGVSCSCGSQWPVGTTFCGDCGGPIGAGDGAPPGWEEHEDDDGNVYYYDPDTGETKWRGED